MHWDGDYIRIRTCILRNTKKKKKKKERRKNEITNYKWQIKIQQFQYSKNKRKKKERKKERTELIKRDLL